MSTPTGLYNPITAAKVAAAYGLDPRAIGAPQSGYRNQTYAIAHTGGQTANLILYKSEPGIRARVIAANAVSDYLAGRGLPTRRTLGHIVKIQGHTRAGAPRTKYACLYNYLPGHTIPWEAYTRDHIKLLGAAMGRMHAELAAAPESLQRHLPSVSVENRQILDRMRRYCAEPGVTAALKRKLGLTLAPHALPGANAALTLAVQLPGHQPLHLDFVRGNLLFGPAAGHPETPHTLNGLALTGIIDFEKTALGAPLFDLARTLAFLLVDVKTKTPAQVYKHFLHSGYRKRGGQEFEPPKVHHNGRGVDLLQALINFYLLHDFYKFLRHNPYEFLAQNEHFVRTVALLQQRGWLR
jgi:Ser/Thr protein kinase RdoA (MazF antagonist)